MFIRRPILFGVMVVTGCVFLLGADALTVRAEQVSIPASTSLGMPMPLAQADQPDPEAMWEAMTSGPEGQKLMRTFQWAWIIMTIAGSVSFVGGVWMLVNAFRVSVWWGLGYLFVPFVALFFTLCALGRSKEAIRHMVPGGPDQHGRVGADLPAGQGAAASAFRGVQSGRRGI